MAVLPPGTLLQLMYLRERLRHKAPGRFIEIGPGAGEITRVLLELGWLGTVYDLDNTTIAALETRFAGAVAAGRLSTVCADFVARPAAAPVDLVISCMVMEHMDDEQQAAFLARAAEWLSPSGMMLALVPASPAHWGIEDDIAGHCRRYTRASLSTLLNSHRWQVRHLAGLTYPVSNLLLPVSNWLVRRAEAQKLSLSALERTKQSGRRLVRFKTHFPALLGVLLNEVTLWPLHVLQKLCRDAEAALVLLVEAEPPSAAGAS